VRHSTCFCVFTASCMVFMILTSLIIFIFHDLTNSDRHGVCFILYYFKKHTETLFGLVCMYTNNIHDVCSYHHLLWHVITLSWKPWNLTLLSNITHVSMLSQIATGVVFMMSAFLITYTFHCTWVTSEAYSSPSIVLSARGNSGDRIIFDDFREAYYWLRHNTAEVGVNILINNLD